MTNGPTSIAATECQPSRPVDRHAPLPSRGSARLAFATVLGIAASWATAAFAQLACPSSDPDTDYNCPVGPAYVLPSWGNVPWSSNSYYLSIQAGDLDDDGKDDLVGRDALGLHMRYFDAATGLWRAYLTTDGSQELVLGISDAIGYGKPEYGFSLVDLDGSGVKRVVVRTPSGLDVYTFVRGADSPLGYRTGTWTGPLTTGVLGDDSCFANRLCWNAGPYYQTIRWGDLDGKPGAEFVAWGGDGIVAYRWSNGTFVKLASPTSVGGDLRSFGALALPILGSMQIAQLDATPGGALVFMSFTGDGAGLYATKFRPNGGSGAWAPFPGDAYYPLGGEICAATISCYATLRAVDLDGAGVQSLLVRQAGCVNGGGITVANVAGGQWTIRSTGGPFSDCGFDYGDPSYALTIQLASITGDRIPQLIGRGPQGIVAYAWTGDGWDPIVSNMPQLDDTAWKHPSYYLTIGTANAGPGRGAALYARGQVGVRTWVYRNGTFSRPTAYGGYPQFTGAALVAYQSLSDFLGLANGVRGLYTDPSVDTPAVTLAGTQLTIGQLCTTLIDGAPPQYKTCALPGTSSAVFTPVANQLIRELWLAGNATSHFAQLQKIQTGLFVTQNSTAPAIGADLGLAQAANISAGADYLGLFSSFLELIGQFIPAPFAGPVSLVGESISVLASLTSTFADPSVTTFQQTYDQVLGQVAAVQSQMSGAVLAQKHHVLGDYGLLGTVGGLVGTQVWTLDEAGFASASRQAFAVWVYQTLLPSLWNRYDVIECKDWSALGVTCDALGGDEYYTANVVANPDGSTSFSALLPIQDWVPTCNFGVCNTNYTFVLPQTNIVTTLFAPVTPTCTYSPTAGTSWTYASAGQGCSFGTGPEIFANEKGWNFGVTVVDVPDGTATQGECKWLREPGRNQFRCR